MADVPNRAAVEKELARIVARALGEQRKKVLELLGDPPNLDNLTKEAQEELSKILRASLGPQLQAIFLQQAQQMLEEQAIGVDWALVNQAAADWAGQYTFALVKDIDEKSRALLQQAVSTYYRDGQTLGQLEAALAQTYSSPVRAEMIATTETTRAAVQGEASVAAELADLGIAMVEIWVTENDAIVRKCPICWPAHKKRRDESIDAEFYGGRSWGEVHPDGPPGHPRCRCWTIHELPKGKHLYLPALAGKLFLPGRLQLSAKGLIIVRRAA